MKKLGLVPQKGIWRYQKHFCFFGLKMKKVNEKIESKCFTSSVRALRVGLTCFQPKIATLLNSFFIIHIL